MKNGLGIGALVLALFVRGADLLAEDMRWRAVEIPPEAAASAVTLGQPIALKARPVSDSTMPTPLAVPTPSGLLPVNYEVPAVHTEPASRPYPVQDIIAVSAPVQPATPIPINEDGEPTESLFAVDRLIRPVGATGPLTTARPAVGTPAPLPTTDPSWNANWSLPSPSTMIDEADVAFGSVGAQPIRRLYVSGEYLLWWLKGDSIPVLATTSNIADSGILGAPSTTVLFGGNAINTGPASGARFTAGYWFDCEGTKAIEVSGFFVGPLSSNFSTNSSVNPVIGRPFLRVDNNQEFTQLTSTPNEGTGTLTIHSPTSLWGLESNLRCLLCCGCNYRVSALAGFRNINLSENVSVTENIQALATAPAPFTNEMITVNDRFATQNHFYGGQVGADARWYLGRWSLDARGKVALGDTVQQLDISGSQRFVSPTTGTVQNFQGGLLALPSNIGRFNHNALSVVPELTLTIGYQIRPYLRGFVGYNFLYWSNVIRPGTSIDRGLDVTQIPNFPLNPEPAPLAGKHPAASFNETNFWAQGITFGLQFTY